MTKISAESYIFNSILEDYLKTKQFLGSRIRQDLNNENSTRLDYKGREIYELLQNAEDAKAETVEIILDTRENLLSISNMGDECLSFTEEGFSSIMMAGTSPKQLSKQSYIGNKGLGFRSILNWSDVIRIHSSGVCCEFSSDIILEYWENKIKSNLPSDIIKQHEDFAQKLGVKHPMAILAIPKVREDNDSSYTTKIDIKYKPDCIKSIKEQIDSLSGKVLLFLSNIREIIINIDGEKHSIKKKIKANSSNIVTVYDKHHRQGIEYITHKVNNTYHADNSKRYEVCIAYTKDEDKYGDYLYTFFPTKVRIGLPCVIHATFELNSSRNALIESDVNNWMQGEIARCLKEFAVLLADNDTSCSWNYVDLISLNEYDKRDFTYLRDELSNGKSALRIYPTYSGYKPLDQTVGYSADFARFVSQNKDLFSNHLLEGFERYFSPNQNADDSFIDIINDFSKQIASDDLTKRVELIYALSSISYNTDNRNKLIVLSDSSGNIINGVARINVGEEIADLPSTLDISYVDKELVNSLIKRFYLGDSNVRGLTTKLSSFGINVTNLDITATKDIIISYLKRENLSESEFVQLMYALFNKLRETDSTSLRELFQRPDFKVLAKDGKLYFPCEVVFSQENIYQDHEQLIYSPSKWSKFFSSKVGENITEGTIIDFFCDTVGVAHHIPMDYTPIDVKAHEYLDTYSNILYKQISNHERFYYEYLKQYPGYPNYFHIVKPEFINRLHNEGKSLTFITKLIMADQKAFNELKNTTLHYFLSTIKTEDVKVSYPLYRLRGLDVFKPLSTYITSEKILLDGDIQLENELNELSKEPNAKDMLIMLGARENIGELEIDDLYNLLYNLPQKELKSGIQRLYKSIRDAIKGKLDNSRFLDLSKQFANNGTAYCRKAGGKIEVKPINEIYYWDNVLLPQNILNNKFKLELPTRVGEESVKKIFGVKLAKDIVIEIGAHSKNEYLSELTMSRIRERIRYILAYRFYNLNSNREISDLEEKKRIAQILKNLEIIVYSSCHISVDGEISELQDGDMVSNKIKGVTVFHVCTGMTEIESAFKTPSFCESITEILCISLKVTGNEIANCFRSILKNSIAENEFITKKEISTEIWEDVDRVIGLSDEEKKIWDMLVKKHGLPALDPEKLTSPAKVKIEYLKEIFKTINIPNHYSEFSELTWREKYDLLSSLSSPNIVLDLSVLGEGGLYPFYSDWINSRVNEYKADFARKIYDITVNDNNKDPYWYYDQCNMFYTGDWKFNMLQEHRFQLLTFDELDSILKENIKATFVYLASDLDIGCQWCKNIKDSYLKIIEKYNLNQSNISQRDLSLTIFDGYEHKFEEIVKKEIHIVEADDNVQVSINTLPISFSFGYAKNKIIPNDCESYQKAKAHGSGGKYTSERQKFKAGLDAEKKVISYLEHNSDHFYSKRCSRNLDPTNGDDSLHYDIIYAKIENGVPEVPRYLEVKSMSSDTIIMSKNEYDFATRKENVSIYDFAIVRQNSITIIRAPFAEDSAGKSKLQVITDSYRITMDIDTESGE